jgi:hypothetical protein
MIDINNRSKSLQRYYNKKNEINEKQKEYFRNVYYIKNRNRLIHYQQIYRKKMFFFNTNNTNFKIIEPLRIEKNIRVSF